MWIGAVGRLVGFRAEVNVRRLIERQRSRVERVHHTEKFRQRHHPA